MDHHNVRSSIICPVCGREKQAGLMVCWYCYRRHEMRYGNKEVEMLIEKAEDRLSGRARFNSAAHPGKRR